MAATVDTGSYAVFQYSSGFSPYQVDRIFAGAVPTTSGYTGTWARLFTSVDAAASVSIEGEQIDLQTQEDGILSTVLTAADKWTLNMGIADITANTFKKLLQLNPGYFSSSGTGFPLNANLTGTDLLVNGLPIMIVHKSYQNASTETDINIPVKTDPNTFVFCKAGLGDRNLSFSYDPKAQQVFDITLTAVNTTGLTNSNVLGWYGAVTAATSS